MLVSPEVMNGVGTGIAQRLAAKAGCGCAMGLEAPASVGKNHPGCIDVNVKAQDCMRQS